MTHNIEIIVEINNQKYYLETFDVEAMPITLQISDINDFQNNRSSFSKTITMPLSDNNQKVLGFITNLYIGASIFNPLIKTTCWVYRDNIEIFNGVLEYTDVDLFSKTFNVTIFEDNYTLWKSIENKYLTDLDYTRFDHFIGPGTQSAPIVNSWNSDYTNGYYYGLIDWGTNFDAKGNLQYTDLNPLWYVKTLFYSIFQEAGYNINSNFMNTDRFQNLLVGDGNLVGYQSAFTIELTGATPSIWYSQSTNAGDFSLWQSGSSTFGKAMVANFNCNTIISDPDNSYSLGTFSYTNKDNAPKTFSIKYDIDFRQNVKRSSNATIPFDDTMPLQNNTNFVDCAGMAFTSNTYDTSNGTINSNFLYDAITGWKTSQTLPSPCPGVIVYRINQSNGGANNGIWTGNPNVLSNGFQETFENILRAQVRIIAVRQNGTPNFGQGMSINDFLSGNYNSVKWNGNAYYDATANGVVTSTGAQYQNISGSFTWNYYDFDNNPASGTANKYTQYDPLNVSGEAVFDVTTLAPNEQVEFYVVVYYTADNNWFGPQSQGAPANPSGTVLNDAGDWAGAWATYPDFNIKSATIKTLYSTPGFVNSSASLPKNIKQTDFLNSILKAFNLYIEPSKTLSNTFNIEPRDDYYNMNSTILDWTKKIDMGESIQVDILSNKQYKTNLFTYKSDKDVWNANYTNYNSRVYGDYYYFINNYYLNDTNTIDFIFAPTVTYEFNQLSQRSTVFGPQIAQYDTSIKKINGAVCRLLTRKTINPSVNKFTFEGVAYGYYPYVGHNDDALNPTFDLNFSPVNEVGIRSVYNTTNNNLFTEYWQNTMALLSDPYNRMLTCYFWLNPLDIQSFRFNNLIYLEFEGGATYWRVNRIIDYDPITDLPTKVELIEANDYDVINNRQVAIPKSNLVVNPIKYPNLFSVQLSASNNNNGVNNVVTGINNNIGASNVIVNGNNNNIY
jgi:hypothetical protein